MKKLLASSTPEFESGYPLKAFIGTISNLFPVTKWKEGERIQVLDENGKQVYDQNGLPLTKVESNKPDGEERFVDSVETWSGLAGTFMVSTVVNSKAGQLKVNIRKKVKGDRGVNMVEVDAFESNLQGNISALSQVDIESQRELMNDLIRGEAVIVIGSVGKVGDHTDKEGVILNPNGSLTVYSNFIMSTKSLGDFEVPQIEEVDEYKVAIEKFLDSMAIKSLIESNGGEFNETVWQEIFSLKIFSKKKYKLLFGDTKVQSTEFPVFNNVWKNMKRWHTSDV